MLRVVALVLGALATTGTALSLLRAKAWWIRVWDFPRVQLALLAAAALALWLWTTRAHGAPSIAVAAVLGVVLLWQAGHVWRYTPLAPREVQPNQREAPDARLKLVVSNVLQTNREAGRLLEVLRATDADLVLCVETDDWWQRQLDALEATHRHVVRCALPNTYGMLLYSRLPLEEPTVDFLIEPDIPSIQAKVVLADGRRVWLNCIHPRPPAPGESDESLGRDAELLLVGDRVRDARLPVVVCGDLNDVAWSRTTRLFQKVSRLVDPRKGRGFYATFHARWPGLRWPLDHVFFSDRFRLVAMERLPYVGSDHFPVCATLSLEPDAGAEQEAPQADGADLQEARETVSEAKGKMG